jgi:hypothetical protein
MKSKTEYSYNQLLSLSQQLIANQSTDVNQVIITGRELCFRIMSECEVLLDVVNVQMFHIDADIFTISLVIRKVIEDLFVIDSDIDMIMNRSQSHIGNILYKFKRYRKRDEKRKRRMVIHRYMKLVRIIEQLMDNAKILDYIISNCRLSNDSTDEFSGYNTDYDMKSYVSEVMSMIEPRSYGCAK